MFSKDSIKQFLKPDWRKAMGFIIVFIPVSVIFQLFFHECRREDIMISCSSVIDYKIEGIIFPVSLYFASCLLVFICDKIRKKPAV